ncbi:MAG: hypothetical protein O2887_07825 [Bacteroidetes bacterium]|nr:hypothetical protein [Bacteroidota bacterium]MDA1120388.1 hypothetical protein [Bacteroidota bacterium]
MNSTDQTNIQKSSGRYRTLVVIIGVLVALIIGFSVSATSFAPIVTMHQNLMDASSSHKIWNDASKGVSILHQLFFN